MTVLETLIALGSKPYVFPKNIDKRIEETCRNEGCTVLEIPERGCLKQLWFASPNLVRMMDTVNSIKYAGHYEAPNNIIMVRSSDFVNCPKEEIELTLWHELGHVYYDHHKPDDPGFDEQNADEYALGKLADIYDIDKTMHIFRRWLFKEYRANKTNNTYEFPEEHFEDAIQEKKHSYKHRKELLETYVNTGGLWKFASDFD